MPRCGAVNLAVDQVVPAPRRVPAVVIPGASHWIPLDAPARLNELLFNWLR
jgi:pimeloyl-ACP methyl ester carboxylesterase